MSLTALPVTATDLQNLQLGILRHTNPTEATAEAALINAGATTVAAYTTSLLAQAQAFTVDAEATLEVFTGLTGTSAELNNLVNNFLPAQNAYAIAHGFNTTVFDAEALGLGLSAGTAFATTFGPSNASLPNTVAGDQAAAVAIVNAVFGSAASANLNAVVNQWLANWKALYTTYGIPGITNPTAAQIDLAARGAAAGDAIGTAIANNLGPLAGVAQNVLVNDALFENGQAANAYGVTPSSVPSAPALQGGTQTSNVFTLTPGVDTFSATGANAQFNAPAAGTILGGVNNTLNVSDNLQDAFGDGVLNVTQVATPLGGNPPTAAGITLNGIKVASLTNLSGGGAGFSGNITGLTTVSTSAANNGAETLGIAGQGLNTALSTLNMNANQAFTAFISDAALAGAADAVTVNYTGVQGGAGAFNALSLFNDGTGTGKNGYEAVTVNASGTTYAKISLGGTTTTTSLTLGGAGKLTLSAGAAGDFSKVTTIDATANTGGVIITGAAGIDPAGDTGIGTGLLSGNTALTSFKGGTGNDFIDLTSLSAAQLAGVKADGGAGTDTVLLTNAVVTGGTAATFAGIANTEIIGVTGLGGTVNWANFPTGVTTLKEYSAQSAALTLNNVASGATLDLGTFGGGLGDTVNMAGTGTADVFNLVMGGTASNPFNINGAEIVNIAVTGSNFLYGSSVANTFTASPGGGVAVNISGTGSLGSNALELVGNGTSITATQAGAFELTGYGTGSGLTESSTNAAKIDATASGGLRMAAQDNGNVGSIGVVIKGSLTGANDIAGSIGNDTLSGGAKGDTFVTDGGADAITLGAAGAADHVDLYNGNAGFTFGPITFTNGTDYNAVADSVFNANDQAQAGFWGLAPGSAATYIFKAGGVGAIFDSNTTAAAGVSTDMTTVANFQTGSGATTDVVSFSVSSMHTSGTGTNGNGGTSENLSTSSLSSVPVGNAVMALQDQGTNVAANVSVIELNQFTFANASAVATALHGSGSTPYKLLLSGSLANNADAHILVAYNDTAGNVRIADVDFYNNSGGATNDTTVMSEYASDMVQLTGVSLASLNANNVHFVA